MKRFFSSLSLFLVLLTYLVSSLPVQAAGYWAGVADDIAGKLGQSVVAYSDGNPKAAKRAVIDAYFGVFEGKKMEAALRMETGSRHAYQVEKQFGALRKMIQRNEPVAAFQHAVDTLIVQVKEDAHVLDQAGIAANVFNPQ